MNNNYELKKIANRTSGEDDCQGRGDNGKGGGWTR